MMSDTLKSPSKEQSFMRFMPFRIKTGNGVSTVDPNGNIVGQDRRYNSSGRRASRDSNASNRSSQSNHSRNSGHYGSYNSRDITNDDDDNNSNTNSNNNNSTNDNTDNNKRNKNDESQNHSPCDRLSFNVAVHENKNSKYRPTMEDVHTYVANFAERLDWGYFAVFDGHAGKQSSRWCGSNLHNILVDKILKDDYLDLRINLNNAFLEADESLSSKNISGASGCTAAVAVLRWEEEVDEESALNTPTLASPIHKSLNNSSEPFKNTNTTNTNTSTNTDTLSTSNSPFDFIPTTKHKRMLYTANVGDTRIILNRGGRAIRLTYDHKSSDRKEQRRIIQSGGLMLKNRVNGVLAVTRSLGDVYMKKSVIGSPYTSACEIDANDDCLIIACDGLWDVCTDAKAIELIKDVQDSETASKILCDYAMRNNTTDNVTCMVIKFDKRVFAYKNPGTPSKECSNSNITTPITATSTAS